MKFLERTISLAATLLLVGCAADGKESAPAVLQNGVGRSTVKDHGPALGVEAWSVSHEPAVSIGQIEGAPEYWFGEIMGMTRLSDGRIVVADMGTSQLRFYSAEGRFLRAVGRRGEGPGEFVQIESLFRTPGDSLLVREFSPRVHLFDPEGRFVRMIRIGGGGPFGNVLLGALSDGTYLAGGVVSDSMDVLRVSADGEVLDTVGRFRFRERGPSTSEGRLVVFAPRAQWTVGGDRLFYGYPERYEIGRYTPLGGEELRVQREWTARKVTDQDRNTYREHMIGAPGEDGRPVPERLRAQRERIAASEAFADEHPAFLRMLVDPSGNLWVQETSVTHQLQSRFRDTHPEPSHWSVFDPQGRWVTDVKLPSHYRLMEVGDDYVLGLARDEHDVEMVRMYTLRRR